MQQQQLEADLDLERKRDSAGVLKEVPTIQTILYARFNTINLIFLRSQNRSYSREFTLAGGRSRRSRRYNNRRMKRKFSDIHTYVCIFASLSVAQASLSLCVFCGRPFPLSCFFFLLVIAFFVRASLTGRIRSILALCFSARMSMERMGGIACNHCSDL